MTVDIEDVLRGKFEKGQRVVLAFDESLSKIFPGKSPGELRDLRCVIAFFQYSPMYGLQKIGNIYSPFPGQKFTQEDVGKLKAKLQVASFPNRECIMLSVTRVSPRNKDGFVEADGRIEEILLGDPAGELDKAVQQEAGKRPIFTFILPPSDSAKEQAEINKLRAGTKCILGFDYCKLDDKPSSISNLKTLLPGQIFGLDLGKFVAKDARLWNVTTPFPGQKFTAAEVTELKRRLAAATKNNNQLQDILQKYIEKRWTVDHIRQYCKPERRVAEPLQDLNTVHNSFRMGGVLYPSLKSELGEVTWYCGVDNGIPDMYSVSVFRKTDVAGLKRPDHWILEMGHPSLTQYSENDFISGMLTTTLFYCGFNFDRVHRNTRTTDLTGQIYWIHGQQVVRDKEGRVKAFSCQIADGRTLCAELSQNLEIKSVLVNGKVDPDWTSAVSEASKNIDYLNRQDEYLCDPTRVKP